MERGIVMAVHAVLIGVVLFMVMVFVLGQRKAVAENRSVLIAALALTYMILFGHGPPTGSLNRNLW